MDNTVGARLRHEMEVIDGVYDVEVHRGAKQVGRG
jgi:hypothetical protein